MRLERVESYVIALGWPLTKALVTVVTLPFCSGVRSAICFSSRPRPGGLGLAVRWRATFGSRPR